MAPAGLAGDPFDALGDPHRRAIVEMLGAGERSVREIAETLPISRPAVSRHLKLLKDAGLVVEEPRGTQRIYRLHDQGVAAVRTYLEQVWGDAAARLQMFAEAAVLMDEDSAFIPTAYRKVVWAMRKNVRTPVMPNDQLDLRFVNID